MGAPPKNKQRHGLPTGNLKCERYCQFSTNAHSYQLQKQKIRNNVMPYWKVQNTVYPAMKIITKLFDERENQWMTNQRKACEERTKLKLQKAVNLNVMVMWLLSDCKSWRGPVKSAVEILEVLKRNPDKQKFILRTELAYFTDTHKTEKIQRPDLFRQNVISIEEKLCRNMHSYHCKFANRWRWFQSFTKQKRLLLQKSQAHQHLKWNECVLCFGWKVKLLPSKLDISLK